MENKPYQSIREFAANTGLSVYYVRELITAQKLPHILSGKKVLIFAPGALAVLESTARVKGATEES